MTSEESGKASSEMWEKLARQLSDAIPDIVIADDLPKALKFALCADVCFWQSTGEADAWNLREALAALTPPGAQP